MKALGKPRCAYAPAEDEMIRQFAHEGLDGLCARMPWRSRRGIKDRATFLGADIRHGNHDRGAIPANTPPLIKRLYEELENSPLTRRQVERRAGIHAQCILAWQRRSPRLDLFVAALNAMDLDLAIVHRAEDA